MLTGEPPQAARYFVFERIINAAVERGSDKCSKVSHRIADSLQNDKPMLVLARLTMPGVLDIEKGAHGFMKARCGLCPAKCGKPVQ